VVNKGNMCYLISVVQALTYSPLAGYLLLLDVGSAPMTRDSNMVFDLAQHMKGVWAFNEVLKDKEAKGEDAVVLDPSLLTSLQDHFNKGAQEDAHECLTFIMKEFIASCAGDFVGEQDETFERGTLAFDVFGFDFAEAVVCSECQHSTPLRFHTDTSLHLNVDLGPSPEQATTLAELMRYNFAPGPLEGYRCDNCNQSNCSSKNSGFGLTPNSLVVYLSRCGDEFKKTRRVNFDEVLDLGPYLMDALYKKCMYSLESVVVHHDVNKSTSFGHYVCYSKDGRGRWWLLDDAQATLSSWKQVQNEAPLLFFYRKDVPRDGAGHEVRPIYIYMYAYIHIFIYMIYIYICVTSLLLLLVHTSFGRHWKTTTGPGL
jgi:ubiquitin carboxyl-terminal hydrolase 36/42